MRIALYGGSFDPVHKEHRRLVEAAIAELKLDKVIVIPSYRAPHKALGAHESGAERLALLNIAFRDMPSVEVSDYELAAGGTSYSYLTCAHFAERYPDAERFFLVGADMLENFFDWYRPEDILKRVTLVACGRAGRSPAEQKLRFSERFGCDFLQLSFAGEEVSSTDIRVLLAFGKSCGALDDEVAREIRKRGLYTHPAIFEALALEKEERREHSFRVALMAVNRAKSLSIPEEKALLAAALHDCGKYVPLPSPLLKGFSPPEGVPQPVLHQYTGAYLAEHVFGITDREILDAIRYHTSGRAGMSTIEKLIYLSDLLEEGRTFAGVEELRALFWQDLDRCLYESLKRQIEYLNTTEKPVYPLTEEAFRWISEQYIAKNGC